MEVEWKWSVDEESGMEDEAGEVEEAGFGNEDDADAAAIVGKLDGLAGGSGVETGMNDTDNVPLNLTILTLSATGRTAALGRGKLRIMAVSIPSVIASERSTSIHACSLPSPLPPLISPIAPPGLLPSLLRWSSASSPFPTRQLLKMGNSSPKFTSVTLTGPIHSGF